MKRTYFFLIGFSLVLIITGCVKEEFAEGSQARGSLLGKQQKSSLTKEEIVSRLDELSTQDAQSIAKYDIEIHAITYRTNYLGKPINTKGVLFLPKGIDSIKLLAYFHGTQIPLGLFGVDKVTPSRYNGESDDFGEIRNLGLSFATAGYGVFLPDYIGYGITSDFDHPYVHYPEMFVSNIDGLLAAKQFLAEGNYKTNNKLYITGWSQGGGACLSAHKYIQEQYSNVFSVVASSSLAGPHNFERFALDIFNRREEEVKTMLVFGWAMYALNKFSPSLQRPTDQIFSYPVYDQVAAIITPSNVPNEVFNNFFLNRIFSGSDIPFRAALVNNSIHEGWRPVGKVFLHHGDADDIVPYFNSVDANAGLTAAGGDIKFYSYPGGKHDTELSNFILNTLRDFEGL